MRNWRWIPRVYYTNYRKRHPNLGVFKSWLWISRFWGDRLINIGVRYHVITLDFRRDWVGDLLSRRNK